MADTPVLVSLEAVDPRLDAQFDEGQVLMVLKLGLLCSNNTPMARPSMLQVVRYLDGEAILPDNLRVAAAFDSGKGVRFDEFLHSFASSPFDGMSSTSFVENGHAATSFASVSTSPLSLLRETR